MVCSPLVDAKEFPENVDVTLVEGAVASEEDLHKISLVRERTKMLVSLGDCAVTGNVPPCATTSAPDAVLQRAYLENVTLDAQVPRQVIPPLLAQRAAGARGRAGGCVRARLPAARRT